MLHPAPPVPAAPPPIWLVPFISPDPGVVPFFHRMSDLPSPLKSPVPAMLHPAPPVPAEPPPIWLVPFISQIHAPPVLAFPHNMSDLPSPLKSPVPAIFHPAPPVPAGPLPIWLVPFHLPDVGPAGGGIPHNMSDLPSPLKSPVPAMLHPAPPVPAAPLPICAVRSSPRSRPRRSWRSATECPTCRSREIAGRPLPGDLGDQGAAAGIGPQLEDVAGKTLVRVQGQIEVLPLSLTCSTLPDFSWTVPALLKVTVARSTVSPGAKPVIVLLGIAMPAICNWPPLPLKLIPPLTIAPISRSSTAPDPPIRRGARRAAGRDDLRSAVQHRSRSQCRRTRR